MPKVLCTKHARHKAKTTFHAVLRRKSLPRLTIELGEKKGRGVQREENSRDESPPLVPA